MAIEIVDLPFNSMVDLSIAFCMFTRGYELNKPSMNIYIYMYVCIYIYDYICIYFHLRLGNWLTLIVSKSRWLGTNPPGRGGQGSGDPAEIFRRISGPKWGQKTRRPQRNRLGIFVGPCSSVSLYIIYRCFRSTWFFVSMMRALVWHPPSQTFSCQSWHFFRSESRRAPLQRHKEVMQQIPASYRHWVTTYHRMTRKGNTTSPGAV